MSYHQVKVILSTPLKKVIHVLRKLTNIGVFKTARYDKPWVPAISKHVQPFVMRLQFVI